MNAIRTVIKIHTRGKLIWFFLPWMGLLLQFLAALIVILIIILLFRGKTPFYPGGLITICVIMFLVGIMSLADTFPFALGFGVLRTDYVLGTTVMAGVVSAVPAGPRLRCSALVDVARGGGIPP